VVTTSPLAITCASTAIGNTRVPAHGSGVISGTMTVAGRSYPFSISFTY
jgi:hypothetical protein